MKEEKILKKEGIELVSKLSEKKIKSFSEKISKKICLALPEYNLNNNDIYTELSKTNMYLADFNTKNIGAKYYYKNHSIYFNRKYTSKKLSDLAVHECIHFIQEKRTPYGTLSRFGLYNLAKLRPTGQALNEAAVQLMTAKINKTQPDYVKYYDLNLYTPSPEYYPIECALLNQIAYFIGVFPIFHSTLYSDDVFKTTFITKTNAHTYKYIEYSFDLISEYEDKLSSLIYTLSNTSDEVIAKKINQKINTIKTNISQTILYTQEKILTECLNSEIHNAKDLKALSEIKTKLLNFKKYLIQNDDYKFYDLFSATILGKVAEKEDFIKNYGIHSYLNNNNQYLPILVQKEYDVGFFLTLISKTKKILKHMSNVKKATNTSKE